MGTQKIFDNLVIISNNAEPDSIECTIIGDAYNFNKEGIYNSTEFGEDEFKNRDISQNFNILFALSSTNNLLFTTKIKKDNTLNQYTLSTCSKLRNVLDSKYGRRIGNMTYLEDKWNISFDPIYFKNKYKKDIELPEYPSDGDEIYNPDPTLNLSQTVVDNDKSTKREILESNVSTVKLRDKWMKVRIKYRGDKLVVISAIQSLFTTSFA